MRGAWLVLVALCLTGADWGVNGQDVMGRLHWCDTLCICHDDTREEIKCFERGDIYQLLQLNRIQVIKLEKTNWKLENQVLWCNDTCLCHQNTNQKVFKCVDEDVLHGFISDKIGDMYFYEGDENPSGGEEEEDAQDMDHRKRSEERRKNRRNRKPKKRVKNVTTTTPTPEVVEVETTPQTEVVSTSTPDDFRHTSRSTPASEIRRTSSGFSEQMPTSSETMDTSIVTEATPYDAEMMEDEEHEDAAELLPKQEAVAASPAVTAMQPPTRRQSFHPTVSSHAATREAETLAPKVSAILEVPVQRKTVASEVSQDLDELGSAVMQIKSDVVLNQRILLVTVAVAGIAMLGVLVLAVHSCFASKRQAAATQEKRPKESSPKDDNHVTKVNLEEAW